MQFTNTAQATEFIKKLQNIDMIFECANENCAEHGNTWLASATKELGWCTLDIDEADTCKECGEIGQNVDYEYSY